MKKHHIKILEYLVHVLVIIVFIRIGYNNYELFDAFNNGFKTVGFTVATNIYTGFITIFIFSLYIMYWFVLYYGIFNVAEKSISQKFLHALIAVVIMTLVHVGSSYMLVEIFQSTTLQAGERIEFKFLWDPTNSIYSWYLMLTVITFAFWGAIEFLYRYEELLNADRLQSELSLVKSQIRPHFFFNTLNNMYSMALEAENEQLADGIQNLTGLMRYALENATRETISLEKEWRYLNKYLELQKLRIDLTQTSIEMEAEGDLESVQIAPMILINFLENAFKHGISQKQESFITAKLKVSSDHVHFYIQNSIHTSSKDKGSGIGTKQTKKLLNLVYGNSYRLNLNNEGSLYSVELTLPKKI